MEDSNIHPAMETMTSSKSKGLQVNSREDELRWDGRKTSFESVQSLSVQELLSRQMENRLLLEGLLRSESGQLHTLNVAIKELEKEVVDKELWTSGRKGTSKMIESSQALEREIQALRDQCEALSIEVTKLTGDAVPLGETSIEFYESLKSTLPVVNNDQSSNNLDANTYNNTAGSVNNVRNPSSVLSPSTPQHMPHRTAPPPPRALVPRRPAPLAPPSLSRASSQSEPRRRPLDVSEVASVVASLRLAPEGPQWPCSACTFLNHPALDRCEECEMPRIGHSEMEEQQRSITDQLAANPGNPSGHQLYSAQGPLVHGTVVNPNVANATPLLPNSTVYWWPVYSQASHNSVRFHNRPQNNYPNRGGGLGRPLSSDTQQPYSALNNNGQG